MSGPRGSIAIVVTLQTSICRTLGIDYPILSVGFGVSAGPELASAVSNSGGCGVLGASTGSMPIDVLRRRVRRCRESTQRPFGINFLIGDFEDPEATEEDRAWTLDRVAMAIEERVPILVLFWGSTGNCSMSGGRPRLERCGTRPFGNGRRPVDRVAASGRGRELQ